MNWESSDTKDALQTGSQQSFISEWWKMDHRSVTDLIHGLVYARWPYIYIGIGKGDHPINETLRPAVHFIIRFVNVFQPESLNPEISPMAITAK